MAPAADEGQFICVLQEKSFPLFIVCLIEMTMSPLDAALATPIRHSTPAPAEEPPKQQRTATAATAFVGAGVQTTAADVAAFPTADTAFHREELSLTPHKTTAHRYSFHTWPAVASPAPMATPAPAEMATESAAVTATGVLPPEFVAERAVHTAPETASIITTVTTSRANDSTAIAAEAAELASAYVACQRDEALRLWGEAMRDIFLLSALAAAEASDSTAAADAADAATRSVTRPYTTAFEEATSAPAGHSVPAVPSRAKAFATPRRSVSGVSSLLGVADFSAIEGANCKPILSQGADGVGARLISGRSPSPINSRRAWGWGAGTAGTSSPPSRSPSRSPSSLLPSSAAAANPPPSPSSSSSATAALLRDALRRVSTMERAVAAQQTHMRSVLAERDEAQRLWRAVTEENAKLRGGTNKEGREGSEGWEGTRLLQGRGGPLAKTPHRMGGGVATEPSASVVGANENIHDGSIDAGEWWATPRRAASNGKRTAYHRGGGGRPAASAAGMEGLSDVAVLRMLKEEAMAGAEAEERKEEGRLVGGGVVGADSIGWGRKGHTNPPSSSRSGGSGASTWRQSGSAGDRRPSHVAARSALPSEEEKGVAPAAPFAGIAESLYANANLISAAPLAQPPTAADGARVRGRSPALLASRRTVSSLGVTAGARAGSNSAGAGTAHRADPNLVSSDAAVAGVSASSEPANAAVAGRATRRAQTPTQTQTQTKTTHILYTGGRPPALTTRREREAIQSHFGAAAAAAARQHQLLHGKAEAEAASRRRATDVAYSFKTANYADVSTAPAAAGASAEGGGFADSPSRFVVPREGAVWEVV